MEKVFTCVGRLTGRCKLCLPDLGDCHPNNRDCDGYVPVVIVVVEVKEKVEEK